LREICISAEFIPNAKWLELEANEICDPFSCCARGISLRAETPSIRLRNTSNVSQHLFAACSRASTSDGDGLKNAQKLVIFVINGVVHD